jgi:hypothetical protein
MTYHPHTSYPGFGWIEPMMTMDDPLIAEAVAAAIIAYHNQQMEVAYANGVDMAELLGYGCDIT